MAQEIEELKKKINKIEKELNDHKDFIDTLMSYEWYCGAVARIIRDRRLEEEGAFDPPKRTDRLQGKKNPSTHEDLF